MVFLFCVYPSSFVGIMMGKQIVLATYNKDKVEEIRKIIAGQFELLYLEYFPNAGNVIENGETLLDNALKKARASFQWTQLPSIADDTGLEVDALNGAPGVRSARFAGEDATYRDNNDKLLRLLKDVPLEKRTARFRTVAALVDGSREAWVEGACQGMILDACRGEGGFGYDPLFFIPDKNKTFAEMKTDEKNEVSHRGIAFQKMAQLLQGFWM